MTEKKTDAKTTDAKEANEDVEEVVEVSDEERQTGDARKRDLARGYERRVLGDGSVDFLCLVDQWTSRDERVMQDHVANYRQRVTNFVG